MFNNDMMSIGMIMISFVAFWVFTQFSEKA